MPIRNLTNSASGFTPLAMRREQASLAEKVRGLRAEAGFEYFIGLTASLQHGDHSARLKTLRDQHAALVDAARNKPWVMFRGI